MLTHLCECRFNDSWSVMVLIVFLKFCLQITYSVPYAMVSARIEALGLGQGWLGCVSFCV